MITSYGGTSSLIGSRRSSAARPSSASSTIHPWR
jgi:hypothetical protein